MPCSSHCPAEYRMFRLIRLLGLRLERQCYREIIVLVYPYKPIHNRLLEVLGCASKQRHYLASAQGFMRLYMSLTFYFKSCAALIVSDQECNVQIMHATHGSATSMDRIRIHGNRYLFIILFYGSHGQISINRIYLPIDIGDIHEASTKSMEKQSNMPPLPASFPTPFPHQSGYTNHAICESFRRHCESDIGAFFSCWFDHSMWGFLNI